MIRMGLHIPGCPSLTDSDVKRNVSVAMVTIDSDIWKR
jgi:hypothetical protein